MPPKGRLYGKEQDFLVLGVQKKGLGLGLRLGAKKGPKMGKNGKNGRDKGHIWVKKLGFLYNWQFLRTFLRFERQSVEFQP